MEGVDYSTGRPNLDQLWTAGKRFVCRYLAYLPNPKVLTGTELYALHNKGFGVVLNWEQASGDMAYGFSRGQTHAREAFRQAQALNAPGAIPVYFSCDFDVTSSATMTAVRDYLAGAVTVLGRNRVGVYGEYDVIETMVGDVCDWGWQTYAWSGGRVSGKAHIYQYRNAVPIAGAECDLDRTLQDNFGAWYKGGNMSDADYRPFGPPKAEDYPGTRTPDTILADIAGEILGGHSPWDGKTSRFLGSRLTDIEAKLDQVLNRAPITDEQITMLATKLAAETDTTVIAESLRDVLRKGVDNAG